MIKKILNLAIIGLVFYGIWLLLGMVISGTILTVAGVVLVLIFAVKVLEAFGIDL